jgi:RNA polymerase sporulation-specific sigma factor
VRFRARRFFLQGAEYDDLVQEGMIGLFKAVRDFREDGGHFRTFAELCITRQIITAVKTASRLKHYPLNSSFSLEAPRYDDADGCTLGDTLGGGDGVPGTRLLEAHDVVRIMRILKQHLSVFEFGALRLWLEGHSYSEIADQLGKHVKSVDNGLWRVKCKIRRLLARGVISAEG